MGGGYIDTNSFGFHGYIFRITPNFSNRTVDISLIQDSNNSFRAYAYISEYNLSYGIGNVLSYMGI